MLPENLAQHRWERVMGKVEAAGVSALPKDRRTCGTSHQYELRAARHGVSQALGFPES
jgi:hypothetical protein